MTIAGAVNGGRPGGRTVVILPGCLAQGDDLPFGEGSEGLYLLRLAALLAGGWQGRVLLLRVLAAPEGESLSAYSTQAQMLRRRLEQSTLEALSRQGEPAGGSVTPVVRVAREGSIGREVRDFLSAEPGALLLLPLGGTRPGGCDWLSRALRKPLPCDLAWVRLPRHAYVPSHEQISFPPGMRVLLPVRGGPQAEMALELSQALKATLGAHNTVLHMVQAGVSERLRAAEEAPFNELLERMQPERSGAEGPLSLRHLYATSDDPASGIARAADDYDLVIMGGGPGEGLSIGKLTRSVARTIKSPLIAVKTRVPVGPAIRAARKRARPHALQPEALSLIVDKWFAENTFHANEFSDLKRLVEIKRQRGLTISLGLPALNEEETIGGVISVLKESLLDRVPLLDEIVVIDSNSTDRTREIAEGLGVSVYTHQQILPQAGEPQAGKGEALWKSLHVLKGDIIAWVDTDVTNMHPQFVYGLIGPLLREPRLAYVKGYYHRPIRVEGKMEEEGGGRVTELTVRPLLNLFFPLLSGVVQPLSGEYAGRREVLEQLPFFTGYGVETGLLIDLLERYGLYSIGQVNLEKRIHRNRPLADLSLSAFAIVQVILTRLEDRARITLLEEVNRSMKLIRFDGDHLSLDVRQVHDHERPPIVTVAGYRGEWRTTTGD